MRSRSPGAASAQLAVAASSNGIFAFVFVAIASRHFGAADAAPVAQVWTIWLAAAALLTFPIQHWVIRTTPEGRGIGATTRRPLVVATCVATLATATILPWRETVFGSDAPVYPLLSIALVAGSIVTGAARGLLISAGRPGSAGLLIGGENLARVLAGGIVILLGGGVALYATSLLAGTALALAVPGLYRREPGRTEHFGRTVGPHGLANGIAQLLLTAGPLLVGFLDASDHEVTALFVTLAVARAPYLLTLSISLTVTARVADNPTGPAARRIHRLVVLTGVTAAALGALAAAGVGPEVIRALFGDETSLDRLPTAMLAASGVLASVALVQGLIAVAAERGRDVLLVWIAACTAAAVSAIAGDGAVDSVVRGTLLGELIAVAGLAGLVNRLTGAATGQAIAR